MAKKRKSSSANKNKHPSSNSNESVSIANNGPPLEQQALLIQYGQLFNEYRWFLFWCVFVGFLKPLADFHRAALDKVVNKLKSLKVTNNVVQLHKGVVARIEDIHRLVVEEITISKTGNNPEYVNPYVVIMGRCWGEKVSDDAQAAVDILHTLIFAIWGNLEFQISNLCRILFPALDINQTELAFLPDSPPFRTQNVSTNDYQLWEAFHAGSIVDQIVRPTHPRLKSDHQRAVYQRVYFIQDHLDQLKRADQPPQPEAHTSFSWPPPSIGSIPILRVAWPPVPNKTLPNLPAGNDDVTDNYVIEFVQAFCQRYLLKDISHDLKKDLEMCQKTQVTQVTPGIAQADKPLNTNLNSIATILKQRQSVLRSAFLQLIYDHGFIPTQEDLTLFKNLAQRLNLQIDIPDLRAIFSEIFQDGQQEAATKYPVDSLFDTLIKRENILPGKDIVQQIVSDTTRLPSPPKEGDIQQLIAPKDYQTRVKLVETFIRDMVNATFVQNENSEKQEWLTGNMGRAKIVAYRKYMVICDEDEQGRQDISAKEAVKRMVQSGRTGFIIAESDKDRKKEMNNMIRYINDVKNALRKQFGETTPDCNIDKGIITTHGPDIVVIEHR